MEAKKKIVITGGTGLIGSELVKKLKTHYTLILLTRSPQKYTNTQDIRYVAWDGKSAITDVLNSCYAVVNLIGENIGGKKWTDEQKKKIVTSRVDSSQAILKSINLCFCKPNVWVQASATGYYGLTSAVAIDETASKGKNSFLADVCEAWEKPIQSLSDDSVRKVIIRTGVVLAPNSDLWKQLTMSYSFGVAVVPGTGNQYLPWIHIDDEVCAIKEAIQNESYAGIYNLVAPTATTMSDIISSISTKKKSLFTVRIPAWFLSILFGEEMTKEIVLTDQKIAPSHLLNSDFSFKFKSIKDAVDDLVKS